MRKFLDGVLFGAGLALSFAVLWTVWSLAMSYFMPRMAESALTTTREPEFRKPVEAKSVAPAPGAGPESRDFSFFKHAGDRMKIPAGGGLLAMSPMSTPPGSKRPSTYQLWLTEAKLWQVRTVEEKVEIEELPYPANASVADLDARMRESLGFAARQSTMTVSADELVRLRTTGGSSRDETLNGKLGISAEGVVFVQPNAY